MPTQQQPTLTTQQSTIAVAESPLTGSTLLTQVSSVLGGVLLLILFIAWLVRKLGLAPQSRHNHMMKVVSSCPVGQRERIVIVEVENTWLVLGVTAQQITKLHTMPAQPIANSSSTVQIKSVDFRQLLQKITKRPEKSE
ncbi:flagellar biosynthetic protein FliO [Prodigiosinella confusarubida]|uniref:Flagellar protein n=1 Tax=Serratia sp. (strain ATCC 39006) TaxID=104623 RepID=A0A2I5TJF9_SERS3|nr:flagellar biosynthetic protein FliO [Serratia sp. ATCC 39006]AUH00376.1 flagellar biosynthetic protein FliO [Serratia sp. ATCC 39006]AUH04696.1 flagellar biosynthetic protein FliO [Serratia sp. ATCC 39006]